jgi:hypothetical protein
MQPLRFAHFRLCVNTTRRRQGQPENVTSIPALVAAQRYLLGGAAVTPGAVGGVIALSSQAVHQRFKSIWEPSANL